MAFKKFEKGVTPVGVAKYPRLNEPDTKFAKDGIGKYSVKLILSAADAKPILEKIEALAETKMAEVIAELKEDKDKAKAAKALAKLKRADNKSYENEVDDTGAETGNVILSFSMPELVKKEGKPDLVLKPQLYDAKGKTLTAPIWGGSKIKVAYELRPYFTGALGVGVSLRLQAVQVSELVTKGMASASYYGFDEVPDADDEETTEEAPEATEVPNGQAKAAGSDF